MLAFRERIVHCVSSRVRAHSQRESAQKGNDVDCSFAGLCRKDGKTPGEMFDETFLRPVNERRRRTAMGYPEPYPHDLNLQHLLPGMFERYRKLAFFAENIRLATVRGLDKWPYLFFGAAGTSTGLHVHLTGTSFTMAVFWGRKELGKWHGPLEDRILLISSPVASAHSFPS
jgi:hypothetical protein